MSRYIMSDIHGHYKEFSELLERIEFKEEDELYINGDLIDRGISSSQLIEFVMENKNVHLILGNHEELFMNAYEVVDLNGDLDIREVTCTDKNGNEGICKVSDIEPLALWLMNGGYETIFEIKRYNRVSGRDLFKEFYEYLKTCPKWLIIDDHIISHAGIEFYPHVDYTDEDIEFILSKAEQSEKFLWDRYLFDNAFQQDELRVPPDYVSVIGHTPIQNIEGYVEEDLEESVSRENDEGAKLVNTDFGIHRSGLVGAYDLDSNRIKVLIDDELKSYKI
ncbi:MAG: metallophosphoesterase [Clostridium sp.]|uniref:metallophosphoesterase n=1 Tax=Clostridium sp. TaxID=1506 RepID=UPI003EE52DAE